MNGKARLITVLLVAAVLLMTAVPGLAAPASKHMFKDKGYRDGISGYVGANDTLCDAVLWYEEDGTPVYCQALEGDARAHYAHRCRDAKKDHLCDVNGCGATVGKHADTDGDGDHRCNYCNGVVEGEDCRDRSGDGDHLCDECQMPMYELVCMDSEGDGDHLCDDCGRLLGECAEIDGDGDHVCVECGEYLMYPVHRDAEGDGDHLCDECGMFCTACIETDPDGDHLCDECGMLIEICEDSPEDEDHLCDECGEVLSYCEDPEGDGDHLCGECGKVTGDQPCEANDAGYCDECGACKHEYGFTEEVFGCMEEACGHDEGCECRMLKPEPTPEPEATAVPESEATAVPEPETTAAPGPEASEAPEMGETVTPEPEATENPNDLISPASAARQDDDSDVPKTGDERSARTLRLLVIAIAFSALGAACGVTGMKPAGKRR